MKEVKGDILTGLEEGDVRGNVVILHGCNCFHIMGAGIAVYLRKKYPIIYAADKETVLGDPAKLGTYSSAFVFENKYVQVEVANCYTQYGLGDRNHKVPVEYGAVRSALQKINKDYDGWEIRTPMIGCGLAGGDWSVVKRIFEEELSDQNITLYTI